MSPLFSVAMDPILFKLANNKEMLTIFDEVAFRPDWTTDNRLCCPERLKILPLAYNGEKGFSTFSRLLSYLRTIQNILIALLAGSQVSNRCPLIFVIFLLLKCCYVCPGANVETNTASVNC